MNTPPLPAQIGRYLVEGVIGRGAMGLVYRAHDPEIERKVAIKLVRTELLEDQSRGDFLARFRREAQAAARCVHPNIVAVYDFALHEGSPFIAMELVEGESLARALASGRAFAPDEAVAIAEQILSALAAAHAAGIVHRDVKPANVLLGPDEQVKMTDFGIARLDRSELTQTGTMVGTLSYMAPEQCRGETVDGRTDLFATGAVIHEMLTGLKAFPGRSETEVMQRLLFQPPSALGQPRDGRIPPPLAAVLTRAMAKDPRDRYASAREMAAALRAALTEATDVATSPFALTPDATVVTPQSREPRNLGGRAARTGTMPGGTIPSGTIPLGAAIAASDAAAAEKALAFFLGPIASVLVRRTVPGASSVRELWDTLATHIERPEDRAAFLRKRPQ